MQAIDAPANETDVQHAAPMRAVSQQEVFDQEALEFVQLPRRTNYDAASTGTLLGLLLARR